MRTDSDLHAAFALLEERADEYGAPAITVGSGPSRRRTRQWWTRSALAATATAAVVAAAVYAATTMGDHRTRPAGPPPAEGPLPKPVTLQYTYTVDPLPGVHVWRGDITRTYQAADIGWPYPGGTTDAQLRVYAPHAYDPSPVVAHGSKVEVGRHQGYFDTTPRDAYNQHQPEPVLAWRYARDSWATIRFSPTDRPFDELRQRAVTAANAMHAGVPSLLKLPFRIGYLPMPLVPETAKALPPDGGHIGLSDGIPSNSGDPTIAGLRIGVYSFPTGCLGSKRVTVHGAKGCFRDLDGGRAGRELSFSTSGVGVLIDIDNAHLAVYPDDVLVKIADSLTFASEPRDYSTWFDARTVLPR